MAIISLLEKKTIEEVTEEVIDYRGKTPLKTKEGIKLITAKVIKDGYILDGNHEYISEETYKRWMTRGFPQKGDILITTEAPLGEVALVRTSERVALAQRVVLLRGKPNLIDPLYYLYALKTPFVQRQLLTRAASTTVLGIKQSELLQVKIPYLPLAEQKRIAAIAQKADRLRRTRRYALQLSDTFLQSVFLEMFGDARTNPNNFPTESLGESLEKFESGINFNPISEKEPASQWRVLKVSAVTSGVFEPYESKPIKPDVTFNDTLIVRKGDLLMSRANTRELVGAVCMVREQPPQVLLPDKLWRIKLSKHSNLEPNYILYALRQPKLRKIIADMASGTSGSMKNISKEQAATLPILIPPLYLQEKFAQIVQKFERLRIQQREAERQAEHLFQTILHRAFRGELTSSDINEEPTSNRLEPNPRKLTKLETTAKTGNLSTRDTAKNPDSNDQPQEIEATQLKLPGFE